MALRHKLSWSSVLLTLAASFAAIILCSCAGVVSSGNQGNPTQTGGPPDAYLYVSGNANSSNNNVDVYAYSAASDGTLTLVSGSPFSSPGGIQAPNGKYLFGTDGTDIYS